MSQVTKMIAGMLGVSPEQMAVLETEAPKIIAALQSIDFGLLQQQFGSALKNLDETLKTVVDQGNTIIQNQGAIMAQLTRMEANAPAPNPSVEFGGDPPALTFRGRKRPGSGDGGDAPNGSGGDAT